MRLFYACVLVALVACEDPPPSPTPTPPSPSSATTAPATPSATPSATNSAAPSASFAPPPPLGSAAKEKQHERLRALVPNAMPPACKLKPVKSDAPPWLKKNPEISSERPFIEGFVPAALPTGTDAAHIQTALYVVYDEGGKQAGLFGFVFATGSMASFVRALFDQARPRDPERFVIEQRVDTLVIQWTDGDKGPCWEALTKHRAKTSP